MPVKVVDKIVPANPTAFKAVDAKNVEYGNNNIPEVDNVQDALDYVYDVVTATPKFWLTSDLRLSSDGIKRLFVKIKTTSPQAGKCKITITNKTLGEVINYTGPVKGEHLIDLGVISNYGTYEYSATASDNYGNAMVVDTTLSQPGSFEDNGTDQYALTFYVVAGSVSMYISSIESNSEIITGNKNLYQISDINSFNETNGENDIVGFNDLNKVNIRTKTIIQFPEVSTPSNVINEYAEYCVRTRRVYLKTSTDYIPAHKYFDLLKYKAANILDPNYSLPFIETESDGKIHLYYRYKLNDTDFGYVTIERYDINESLYTISEEDESVNVTYGFVEDPTGNFYYDSANELYKQYSSIVSDEYTRYAFEPTFIETNFVDMNGNDNLTHKTQSETLYFTLENLYFLNEYKHSLLFRTKLDKSGTIDSSNIVERDIYPADYSVKIRNNNGDIFGDIRTVAVTDIDRDSNINADIDNVFQFIPVSFHRNVQSNITYLMELHYIKTNGNGDTEDIELKSMIKEGCNNLSIQTWNIGRLSKGSGLYYIKLSPSSVDSTVHGSEFILYFNAISELASNIGYHPKNLIACFDAKNMSNDLKNPEIWNGMSLERVINNGTERQEEIENPNYFIRLSGLNYETNGWMTTYDKIKNKQPHLAFTGDSYGSLFRIASSGEETALTLTDILTGVVKSTGSRDEVGLGEATVEIMFRTRCIGEMKACVLSSRNEESNTYNNYTYSDSDPQIARAGFTISHNKAIANTNKDYTTIPYTTNEWKHITFVVNTNVNNEDSTGTGMYNPFPSIKMYIDGVLTSITDISSDKRLLSNDDEEKRSALLSLFRESSQFTFNGHLNSDETEVIDCGESEIRLFRVYDKALNNNEVVNNFIDSIYDEDDRKKYEAKNDITSNVIPIIYFVKNNGVPYNNIRKKNTENTDFNTMIPMTNKADSKKYFVNTTMYYAYPDPTNLDTGMTIEKYDNVDVYLQGTSTLQFPVKNFKIRTYANTGDDVAAKNGAKKLKMIPPNMIDEWVEDSVFTLKCDYMESGHMNNTPTAKFYHHVVRELIDNEIDTDNPNKYSLSKRDYIYKQDQENGKFYIDEKSDVKPIIDESYEGIRYSEKAITKKGSASPSRSYFAFEEDENGFITYTSEKQMYDGNLKFIVTYKENGVVKNTEEVNLDTVIDMLSEVNSTKYVDASVISVYDKANRYYIRVPKSNYSGYEWVEYNPVIFNSDGTISPNTSQYGKILYKINKKYRDSVDGFPCIVYYSDNGSVEYDSDPKNMDGLTLLGTMMFNLDKSAKSLGFTVNPVFEDEYFEYLKSVQQELKTRNITSIEDSSEDVVNIYSEADFLRTCLTDEVYLNNINSAWKDYLSRNNVNPKDTIIGAHIMKFNEFYQEDSFEWDGIKIKTDEVTGAYTGTLANLHSYSAQNQTPMKYDKAKYFKFSYSVTIDSENISRVDYIPYWKLHLNRNNESLYDLNIVVQEGVPSTWAEIWNDSIDKADIDKYINDTSVFKKNRSLYWFEQKMTDLIDPKGIKYDAYATVPAYTYKQRFVQDANGDYIYEDDEYVLADSSISGQRYSMKFDKYRTYFVNDESYYVIKDSDEDISYVTSLKANNVVEKIDGTFELYNANNIDEYKKYKWSYKTVDGSNDLDNLLLRTTDQCVLSYEASTNTRQAAGTFYDMNEAYNKTFSDDFLNKYYEDNFVSIDGTTPKIVEVFNTGANATGYHKISPNTSGDKDVPISIDEFKNQILNVYNLENLNASNWSKELFYIDAVTVSGASVDASSSNEEIAAYKPGPYVFYYESNGKKIICKKNKAGSVVALYHKATFRDTDNNINYELDSGSIISSNEDLPDQYRYKFALKCKSYIYVENDNGTHKLVDREYVELLPNEIYNGTKYSVDPLQTREFSIIDKKTYIGDGLTGSDKAYLDYMQSSFEMRYAFTEEQDILSDHLKKSSVDDIDSVTWNPLKNLLKWVINTHVDENSIGKFKAEFKEHFDLTYTITYYLQMILFAQADNAGKNSMWDTWDGKKFYIRPYDMDTQSGLNNRGLFNVPTSAEINPEQSPTLFIDNTSAKLGDISNRLIDKNHKRYGSYTTLTSRFWNSFAKLFATEIKTAYGMLRDSGMYTRDYIVNYYKEHVTDVIGERYYNSDMNQKYLTQSNHDYLILLMGNRLDQFTRWLEERIIFCDTYFEYQRNDTYNTHLSIRSETTALTGALGISVFSPQYVKISVGMDEDATFVAYVDTNSRYVLNGEEYEGTLFTIPITGKNKEISIYGGGNIKELNNIRTFNASDLNLGNANRLINLNVSNNTNLENLNIANAKYLRDLSLIGCSMLTGNLNASNSTNLQSLDISNSKLSGVSFAKGGNLKKFIARNTTISSVEFNNLQELTDIVIENSDGINPITSYSIIGCPLIKLLNFNTYTNISNLLIQDCKGLQSLFIENNKSLNTLQINDCDNLHLISLKNSIGRVLGNLNFSTVYGLDSINISNCVYPDGINITLPYYASKKIAQDSTIDRNQYSNRWHNLKYFVANSSDIKSIKYGTSEVQSVPTLDFSQLDSLVGKTLGSTTSGSVDQLNITGCNKIENIKGLRYVGNTISFNSDSSLKNIEDSYIYSTNGSMGGVFAWCSNLNDISSCNINLHAKNTSSINAGSMFRSSKVTDDTLRHGVFLTRQYSEFTKIQNSSTLDTIRSNITSNKYNAGNYFVKDFLPKYRAIQLKENTNKVYALEYYRSEDGDYLCDINTNEFGTNVTNPKIENNRVVRYKLGYIDYNEYKKQPDAIKPKVFYYKSYDDTYVVDSFGVYGICTRYTDSTDKGLVKIDSITHVMTENENINAVKNTYAINGNIIVDTNGIHYRYFNNAWETITYMYTMYNANTTGIAYNRNGRTIQIPGGALSSTVENNRERYENKSIIMNNGKCLEYYQDGANVEIDNGLTITYENSKSIYFKIYNKDNDDIMLTGDPNNNIGRKFLYQKNYYPEARTSSYGPYVTNAEDMFRAPVAASDTLRVDNFLFGLENVTAASRMFYDNTKLSTDSSPSTVNAVSNAIKKLRSVISAHSMFKKSSITYLNADVFENMSKLKVATCMFMNTPITTFRDPDNTSNSKLYTKYNDKYVSILPVNKITATQGSNNYELLTDIEIPVNAYISIGTTDNPFASTTDYVKVISCNKSNGSSTYTIRLDSSYTPMNNMYIYYSRIENVQFMFANSSIVMSGGDLNGFLGGLVNAKTLWQMFANCQNLRGMINKPFKDLYSAIDVSSFFNECTNLTIGKLMPNDDGFLVYTNTGMIETENYDTNEEFVLFSLNREYPVVKAAGVFKGCKNVTGYVGKYFFGDITNNVGAVNIDSIGSDIGYDTSPYHHYDIDMGTSYIISITGGFFCNTSISTYHEDFLKQLPKLTDANSVFAKLGSNLNICTLSTESLSNSDRRCIQMYGYVNNSHEHKGGIPETLFDNNPELTDVSYFFAGNKGLGRPSSDINNGDSEINFNEHPAQSIVSTLPNIFRNNKKLKYAIGMFMGTTLHSSDVDTQNSNITNNIKAYCGKYSNDGDRSLLYTDFNSDTFFKCIDENGEYIGLPELVSIKSIFEQSDYRPVLEEGGAPGISEIMFSGCSKLEDVSKMFRHNERLYTTEYVVPIHLFDSCRSSIKDVSSMFQGCKNITGEIPTGDNCWLLAYNNYLDNIKTDPDITKIFKNISGMENKYLIDTLASAESNSIYKQYKIDGGFDENFEPITNLLSFEEFRNRFSKLYSINTVTPTDINNTRNFTQSSSLFVNNKYSYVLNDNDSINNYVYDIRSISDVYVIDRIPVEISNDHIGKSIIDSNENIIQLTSANISIYRGTTQMMSLYNEIGKYVYDSSNASYISINDIPDLQHTTINLTDRYVKRSKVTFVNNRVPELNVKFDIYRVINNEIESDITSSSKATVQNISFKLEVNTKIPNGNYVNSLETDGEYTTYLINDSYIASNNDIFVAVRSHVLNNKVYAGEYAQGLLGSCSKLTSADHMFEGCDKIYGPVPKDIFSAESAKSILSSLNTISNMFTGCLNLGLPSDFERFSTVRNKIDKTRVCRNPKTMYARGDGGNGEYSLIEIDPSSIDGILSITDDVYNNYLVPEDWLSNTPNITLAKYVFARIANNRGDITNVSLQSTKREAGGFVIPNNLFAGLSRVQDISYIFYAVPLIRGILNNQFLRTSLSTLYSIEGAFTFTSIQGSDDDANLRMFEQNSVNGKLKKIKYAFFNCPAVGRYYPRFAGKQFSEILRNDDSKYSLTKSEYITSMSPSEKDIYEHFIRSNVNEEPPLNSYNKKSDKLNFYYTIDKETFSELCKSENIYESDLTDIYA